MLAPEQFRGCISLSDVQLSTQINCLPTGVFRDCSALRRFTVPSSIERIGRAAFAGCVRLESVLLEHGVVRIGCGAFAGCRDLGEVTLPNSVKRLGFGAFGLGVRREKILLRVENEYMVRRIRRAAFLCGSLGCVRVVQVGKTLEERKRERRRTRVEQEPAHLI